MPRVEVIELHRTNHDPINPGCDSEHVWVELILHNPAARAGEEREDRITVRVDSRNMVTGELRAYVAVNDETGREIRL